MFGILFGNAVSSCGGDMVAGFMMFPCALADPGVCRRLWNDMIMIHMLYIVSEFYAWRAFRGFTCALSMTRSEKGHVVTRIMRR